MRLGVVLQLCPLVIHETALTAVQTAPASAQQQYERYFSLALLFVTCRAEITPLHSKISIGNPLCGGKTTGWFDLETPLGETEADERPRTGYGAGSQSFPQKLTVILFGDEAS